MVYIFRSPFKLTDGSVIQKNDAVFVDDINASDEIAVEVAKRIEADKPKKSKTNE